MNNDSFTPGPSLKELATVEEEYHGLDTCDKIFFYEQDHYYLSNFSSFQIVAHGLIFQTSEHLYHWTRFHLTNTGDGLLLAEQIRKARSAHDAFKLAQMEKDRQVENWNEIKFEEMKKILHLKVEQHEYVRRKLLSTGNRQLVENSWRDSEWGIGSDEKGKNMLGKLWMEVRDELRSK